MPFSRTICNIFINCGTIVRVLKKRNINLFDFIAYSETILTNTVIFGRIVKKIIEAFPFEIFQGILN